MISRKILFAAGLLGSTASAQTIPDFGADSGAFAAIEGLGFSVKNNTAASLSCARGVPDSLLGPMQIHWSDRFILESGKDVALRSASSRVYFFCDAPADRNVYALKPGERYSYLVGQAGKIRLRRIRP